VNGDPVRSGDAIVRDALCELRAVAGVMRHVGARESVARLDALALGLVALSIHSVHELVVLVSTRQRKALGVLADRARAAAHRFMRMPISG
jgi:hypothetical protein